MEILPTKTRYEDIYLIMFRPDIRRLAVQTDRVADPFRDLINNMMAAILHPRPDVRRIILSSLPLDGKATDRDGQSISYCLDVRLSLVTPPCPGRLLPCADLSRRSAIASDLNISVSASDMKSWKTAIYGTKECSSNFNGRKMKYGWVWLIWRHFNLPFRPVGFIKNKEKKRGKPFNLDYTDSLFMIHESSWAGCALL